MLLLLRILPLLVFLVFSKSFHQGFLIPKLLAFHLLCIAALWLAMRKGSLYLPGKPTLWLAAVVLTAAVAGAERSDAPITALSQIAYSLEACVLFICLMGLDHRYRMSLLDGLFWVAFAQVPLCALQFFGLASWLPIPFEGGGHEVVGTLGNPEFLATLLGVGFLAGLHFLKGKNHHPLERAVRLAGVGVLLAGIALTGSKGTLAILLVLTLWMYPRARIPVLVGVLAFAVLLPLCFPDSVKGRVLLWFASMLVFKENLFIGVGPGQFENSYLDAVGRMFSGFPALAEIFGSHTGSVRDAHNLPLHFAAELGLMGLAAAVLLLVHAFRTSAKARDPLVGAALQLLAIKCLYTVVLGSVTSLVLFILVLAAASIQAESRVIAFRPRYGLSAVTVALLLATGGAWLAASDFYLQRGLRALFLGNREEARRALGTASRLDPENSEALLAQAYLGFQEKDLGTMDSLIQKTLRIERSMDTYKKSAHMYFYSKMYPQAFSHYRILHTAFPDHLTSTTKLALIHLARQEYQTALELAQEVLALNPRLSNQSDSRNRAIAYRLVSDLPVITRKKGDLK